MIYDTVSASLTSLIYGKVYSSVLRRSVEIKFAQAHLQ